MASDDRVQLSPAASKTVAKAPGFSGQAMISPALWMSRMSAPTLSNGVSMGKPVRSAVSSSMNSMLSLTIIGVIPVEDPTWSWRTDPSSWSSLGTIPISMLAILRISLESRALSAPMGQVWAQRRQRLQR